MKKKPEKKYAPGELDRTRKNIGKISREEAEKMTRILGGDIGIEEDPDDIKNKYIEFQSKIYRQKRYTHLGRKKRRRRINEEGEERRRQPREKGIILEEREAKDATFIDRIKLDFLCSKPEYRLKPLSGAFASLFSIFFQVPDYINPSFIRKAHLFFFNALFNFVTAIRGLYTKTRPEIFEEISHNVFFKQILSTIKKWDINAINLELNILKKHPHKQSVKRLSRLCRYVYTPFAMLFNIESETHIKEAIRWAYNVNMAHTPEKGKMQERIRSFYYEAAKFLPIVFYDIKRMFYPLLLKQITNKFSTYEEFLSNERQNILGFLNLTEENVVTLQAGDKEISTQQDETEKEEEKEGEETLTQLETGNKAFNDGLTLLEFLFPGSGWNHLNVYPDLYPYFQPLFRFPSGFELIPRSDPLHQIIVLVSIINCLFYGFRNIKFNIIRDEKLEAFPVKDKIDSLLSVWPIFVDDIIGDYYISRLVDYCRNLEKDKKYHKTEVAEKLINEMNSIKKTFFLPFYAITFSKIVTGILKKTYPKLYKITEEYTPVLHTLSQEIHQKIKEKREKEKSGEKIKLRDMTCEGVLNPWDKYDFGLVNPVSKRLDQLLVQRLKDRNGSAKVIDRRTNANLIIYTHTLMAMLNSLLNTKTSYYYSPPDMCPFRSVDDAGETPQYTVSLLDPEKIMNEAPQKEIEQTGKEIYESKESIIDQVTGLHSKSALTKEIAREINEVHIHDTCFSLIYLFLPKLKTLTLEKGNEYGEKVSKTCATVMKSIIRRIIDVPFILDKNEYVILLSKTDINRAISVGRRICSDAINTIDMIVGKNSMYVGALQYNIKWNLEKTIKILEKVKVVVKNQPVARIVYLDQTKNTLKAIRL
jgi:diguanylate cyclase (GGDEF)-like protein